MENLFPPLFAVENYSDCIQNKHNLYCNVMTTLKFPRNNHSVMEYVNSLVHNRDKFDRSVIHRAVCIPKNELHNYTSSSYSKYLNSSNITTIGISDIEIVSCIDKYQPFTYYDIAFFLFLVTFLSLVGYATYIDRKSTNKENVKKDNSTSVLKCFSFTDNWKERTSLNRVGDFQKLLSIQGFRFFFMLVVVFLHTLYIPFLMFMSNADELEKIYENYFKTPFWSFAVLPFFMFSSWLLVLQVYNHNEIHKKITLKSIGIMLVNRYLRLAFSVGFLTLILLTSLPSVLVGPLSFTPINLTSAACKNNWYKSLFLMSNFDALLDSCNGVTWYISSDWQLYVINITALYTKLKYKIKEVIFYPILLIGAFILHGSYVLFYGNNNDIIYLINVRHMEEKSFRSTIDYVVYYSSTISNWSCSIVGLILGEIYYKTKNKKIKKNTIMSLVWYLLFFACPTISVILSNFKTNSAKAAILGSMVKPLFNFGIGIGILGMAHNIGGIIKRIVEYKFFVILGNFTFFTYLVHTMILIMFHSLRDWPSNIDVYQIILHYIFCSLITWPLAIFGTCSIEEVGLQLQKRFLPQIKKKKIH